MIRVWRNVWSNVTVVPVSINIPTGGVLRVCVDGARVIYWHFTGKFIPV